MRIIHFADTHLGYKAHTATDENGFNQKEMDIYKVFSQVIDYIIKTNPDLVIHAGDLFDRAHPSNKAITVALEQFYRLSVAKIPLIVIAGNHSTPRERNRETIFKIFNFLPGINSVYGGKYKKLKIDNCMIHAIPHTYSQLELEENIHQIKIDKNSKYNVLVIHGAIDDVVYTSSEFTELNLPKSILRDDLDYIALGHIHSFKKIKDNAYYSGSTERMNIDEANEDKFFLDVNLDNPEPTKIKIKTRDMVDFDTINCENLTLDEIHDCISSLVQGHTKDKIIRINLENIPKLLYPLIDHKKIEELTSDAIHVEKNFKLKIETEDGKVIYPTKGNLNEKFQLFLESKEFSKIELNDIKKLGLEYLGLAQETSEE